VPISREARARYPKNWKAISQRIRFERAAGWCEFCRRAEHGKPHPVTGSIVVLTVAHLDHDETHDSDEDLAAMCQRCHLTYDAPHHAKNAAITRRRKLPQGDLFDRTPAPHQDNHPSGGKP
jgi:hypothetical protein